MPEVFNLYGDGESDRSEERLGWRSKDAWVGRRIGAELIGGSMYELEPDNRLWPYHAHHANEEWLLVVRGRPTLRTAGGEQDLDEGDVVAFPRERLFLGRLGEPLDRGLHQVINHTDAPIRVLMLSTLLTPEIVEYPDSGKVGTRSASGERLFLGRLGEPLDYWEGED